mgnify:CR=1 FL=1
MSSPRASAVRIVHIYPNLLGTYGDAGNAIVLRQRVLARGIPAELITVEPGEALPREGDVYLLGGGEDAKQTAAAEALRADGALVAAAGRGAAVLGICAGYQLLGTSFLGVGGVPTAGLGLLDVTTGRLDRRAVGNVLARPAPGVDLPDLIGFENHGGATTLGPAASALGLVEIGVGNGEPDRRSEGAVQGAVVGTYLHGPALALNPALADLLLAAVAGPLAPIDDALVEDLRRHRMQHVLPATERAARRRSLASRLRRRDVSPSGAAATLSPQR